MKQNRDGSPQGKYHRGFCSSLYIIGDCVVANWETLYLRVASPPWMLQRMSIRTLQQALQFTLLLGLRTERSDLDEHTPLFGECGQEIRCYDDKMSMP